MPWKLERDGRTTDIDCPITDLNLADDVAATTDEVGLGWVDVFCYSRRAGGLQHGGRGGLPRH